MRVDKACALKMVQSLLAYIDGRLEVRTSTGWVPASLGLKDLARLQEPAKYRIVEKQKAAEQKRASNESQHNRSQGRLGTSQNRKGQVRRKTN